MSAYRYYQIEGGEEAWQAVPVSLCAALSAEKRPMFMTVLSVDKLVEGVSAEDHDKLKYLGDFYLDWDGEDMALVAEKAATLLAGLQMKGLDLSTIKLYATGGRGFHAEIPMQCFMEKVPKAGVQLLPVVYKQMAFDMAVDTLDLRVYSARRGRMWRQPNVKRPNGRYKVQITYDELLAMTSQLYEQLTNKPRDCWQPTAPRQVIELTLAYDKAVQDVQAKLSKRKKKGSNAGVLKGRKLPSLEALMQGRGIKTDTGFHQLSMQLAIVAEQLGWDENRLCTECAGLIESHSGNGNRYNTPSKRREELTRMHRYMSDNPCYEFSVGAIKALLNHEAPDLDGIPVPREEIEEAIAAADAAPEPDPSVAAEAARLLDEYGDVAGGVDLTKYGVYIDTEHGKKRICAISFDKVYILRDIVSGQVSCYEADVLVNGKNIGRHTLELEIFAGLQSFNRFCSRLAHAMQGSDQHVRGLMMRVAEKAVKDGKVMYVAKREGLDVVNIPGHEDETLRTPFMIWADARGVLMEPRAAATGVQMSFQGYPDPRGVYRTDLSDAPKLVEWIEEEGNADRLKNALHNFFSCQRPDVIGNLIGWHTATFYRMLFQKGYDKFPALHINGAAGAGKSLRRGTLVILADGTTTAIENVKVGDQLLGPDGGVRNVLALGRGQETMYEVKPVKGDPYYVNESHILSLRRSCHGACKLSDGTYVPADQKVLNVNVKVWSESSAATQKLFKGYRSGPVEFHREQQPLPIPPYILGAWLGDGHSSGPTISTPMCAMVECWERYGSSLGLKMYGYSQDSKYPAWRLAAHEEDKKPFANPAREALRELNLLGNKHIPEAYRLASVEDRLQLLAGLLDSGGYLDNGGYDWSNKCPKMAEDLVFIARSVGLAAYMKPCKKGVKARNFEGTYYRVFISGDCSRIPCLDKVAPIRRQAKNHLVTGLSFKKLGVEDYYGVVLDGDHLFLLGDFTVTHNTEMSRTLLNLFYYNQEPKELTPESTLFAIQQHMSGSASIPLMIDEYKPHEMTHELHNKLKLLFRDAYNNRDVMRGGGNRDSDDYRSLHTSQLSAPVSFIAEVMEEEPAVMERVVLVTVVKPPTSAALKWSARFNAFKRDKQVLGVLGQYIAAGIVQDYSIAQLQEEFDPLFEQAKNKYMLSESDIESNLDAQTLREKQGAKERTVYNFTVSRFGLLKFRDLLTEIFGPEEFAEAFTAMDEAIYVRMKDLLPATQAEYLKVVNTLAHMSYLEADLPEALVYKRDYAFLNFGGKDAIEFSMRQAYHRYRVYQKTLGYKPLFSGDQAFLHAMKDSSALLAQGPGKELMVAGGTYIFDLAELKKLGIDDFKC